MSNSLNPWILDFLLHIAKEFGAKLFDVQPYTKKKRVQIIEFLTYPPKEQNTFIWARISDKKHIATVKFTKQAVETCQPSLAMPRLTQYKGAIATLSKFKPTCSRFPLEQDRMSSEAFIIFECDYVEILGSSGESTFGQPKGIEQDPEISLWSKGIAQGGGAGNVLKERKLEMEGKSLNSFKALPPMPMLSPIPNSQPLKADTNVTVQPAFKRIEDVNRETYKARWHFLEKDRLDFIGPSIDVIKTEEKGQESGMQNTGGEDRSRSGTPISNWENSPTGKARSESPVAMQVDEKRQEPAEDSELRKIVSVSSSLPAPTPAQRSLATPNVVNETQIGPGTRHLPMARKVPRPASPEPAAEQIGPARVLAPNSDTSQSQSQKTQLLGGNVVDTTGQLPWMSMGDVGRVMRLTAELRLRNHSSMKC